MTSTMKPFLTFLLLALLGGAITANAQAPAAKPPLTPVAESAKPDLLLTQQEQQIFANLNASGSYYNTEEQAGLAEIRSALTNEGILAGARRYREAKRDQEQWLRESSKWLADLRRAHACEDCLIDTSDPKAPKLAKPTKP